MQKLQRNTPPYNSKIWRFKECNTSVILIQYKYGIEGIEHNKILRYLMIKYSKESKEIQPRQNTKYSAI